MNFGASTPAELVGYPGMGPTAAPYDPSHALLLQQRLEAVLALQRLQLALLHQPEQDHSPMQTAW